MKHNRRPAFYSDGDKDYDLYLWFMRARDLVFQAKEKELLEYDITPEQSAILFFTKMLGERAWPAEIARAVFRKRHTVSNIIDRMEKKKLIKKYKDPRYKNRLRISLTEKGEDCYNRALGRHSIRRVLSVLSERERKQFMRCLDKVSEQAEKELGLIHEESPASK